MSDISVNSLKASEVSREMVALYLLASIADNEPDAAVNMKDGVPLISGKSKNWILSNYIDCLKSIKNLSIIDNS
ncbi:hypothetical protein HUO14_01400 [Parasphingorhabdus flavimaris]|uniref:Uncharacterized protein n=1 Tax=Parasphingorhabdus flavimaris TaxID=266812 RepID=A0ABX2MYM7_9SPHN|nr:hypothetical protein [Parasphingorhabdus flavimaris]NVD26555.1 hypothetical protein [Parasphingorhabdus flavimaris]